VIEFFRDIFTQHHFLFWGSSSLIVLLLLSAMYFWNRIYQVEKIRKLVAREYNVRKDLTEQDRDWVFDILSTSKINSKDFFENPQIFEIALDRYKEKTKETEPYIKKLPALRNKLGFSLATKDVTFLNTRQLFGGMKLRTHAIHQAHYFHYFAQVLVVYENCFWISAPTEYDLEEELSSDSPITFIHTPNSGQSYKFSCEILHQVNTPIPAIILKHANFIELLNPRAVERTGLQIPVNLEIVTQSNKQQIFANYTEPQPLCGFSVDLSTSGLLFQTREFLPEIEENEKLIVKFQLDEEECRLMAEVVSTQLVNNEYRYLHLRFLDISRQALEIIGTMITEK
jgi:hypothetical protein